MQGADPQPTNPVTPVDPVTTTQSVDEVQSLSVGAVGGSYTLSFRGETTGPIPPGAAAPAVEAALNAISTIGAGGVRVAGAGSPGSPFLVHFFSASLAASPQPLIAASAGVTVGRAQAGVAGLPCAMRLARPTQGLSTPGTAGLANQSSMSLSGWFRTTGGDESAVTILLSAGGGCSVILIFGENNALNLYAEVVTTEPGNTHGQADIGYGGPPPLLGVVYHFAVVHRAGSSPTFYLNGIPRDVGYPLNGTVGWPNPASANVMAAAMFQGSGGTCEVDVSDMAIWAGYALTQQDVDALRDRSSLPTDIAPAELHSYFPTVAHYGGSVANGDSALVNRGMATGLDLSVSGSGTQPSYVAGQLDFVFPSSIRSANIMPSGQGVLISVQDVNGALADVTRIAGADEIQSIAISDFPSASGQFTLSLGGATTASIQARKQIPTSASWVANVTPGSYDVYATWGKDGHPELGLATTAQYEIMDGDYHDGTAEPAVLVAATANQSVAPAGPAFAAETGYYGAFQKIAANVAATGTKLQVRLSAAAGQQIAADAIVVTRPGSTAVVDWVDDSDPARFTKHGFWYSVAGVGAGKTYKYCNGTTGMTPAIQLDPSEVASALQAAIPGSSFQVSGTGPISVTFGGALAGSPQPLLTASGSHITIAETTAGRLGAPSISVDGRPTNLGRPIWGVSGPYMSAVYYPLPAPIPDGSAVTLTAPGGWATSSAGLVRGVTALPISRMSVIPDFDGLPKRMEVGYNVEPPSSHYPFMVYSNACRGTDQFYGVTDSHGYPTQAGPITFPSSPLENIVGDGKLTNVSPHEADWTVAASGSLPTLEAAGADAAGNPDSCKLISGPTVGPDGRGYATYHVTAASGHYSPGILLRSSGPATDIGVYAQGIGASGSPKYRPELGAAIAGCRTLRFMDILATNSSTVVNFSDLRDPADFSYAGVYRSFTAPIASISPADDSIKRLYYDNSTSFIVTFAAPHGLGEGQTITLVGFAGAVGIVGGGIMGLSGFIGTPHVLSPTAISFGGYTGLGSTVDRTYTTADFTTNAGATWNVGTGGMPLSDIVEVCNLASSNLWFNVPHCASDDCVAKMASYIASNLSGGLKCRVEWSNETWNDSFVQGLFCQIQGQAMPGSGGAVACAPPINGGFTPASFAITNPGSGYRAAAPLVFSGGGGNGLAGYAVPDATGRLATVFLTSGGAGYTSAPAVAVTPRIDRHQYAMYRSAKVQDIFAGQFAAAGRPTTDVVRVIGTQAGNPTVSDSRVQYAAANGYGIDILSPASYFNNGPLANNPEDSLIPIFASLTIEQCMDVWEAYAMYTGGFTGMFAPDLANLARYGYTQARLGYYEGGPGGTLPAAANPTTLENQNALAIKATACARHPRLRKIMLMFLQQMEDLGSACFNDFNLFGLPFTFGGYPALSFWEAYNGWDEVAGAGDGSDGLFDNRTDCTADDKVVSVVGGAIRTWVATQPRPTPPFRKPPPIVLRPGNRPQAGRIRPFSGFRGR